MVKSMSVQHFEDFLMPCRIRYSVLERSIFSNTRKGRINNLSFTISKISKGRISNVSFTVSNTSNGCINNLSYTISKN